MKPVCSVRKVSGVHIVSMHDTGLLFAYGENTYEAEKQKEPVKYPGVNHFDPAYKSFAAKRRKEIKQSLVKIRPLVNMDNNIRQFLDSIFNMDSQTKHIHNFKPVQNAVNR